ncbi:hypothetical protein SEA_MUFASA8_80 [Arthrobacter phage Mufasa8]|uniref:Uncharacterized protein n=1 Tax=Arthrobacter phage Mufasa8 TaxID=2656526 RepID=A0A649VMF4_9CAUD|nr:hypothetical protein HYQ08_gp080 [Arthrobacter phage Mufasa8]QGJ93528.1 hypothetical protein SEA_MUFASA8_80 [Arthrobacter phage Mufasa8]
MNTNITATGVTVPADAVAIHTLQHATEAESRRLVALNYAAVVSSTNGGTDDIVKDAARIEEYLQNGAQTSDQSGDSK